MYRERLRRKTGCEQCKQRRKKCDEHRPTCGACRRWSFRCSYSVPPSHEYHSLLLRAYKSRRAPIREVAFSLYHSDDDHPSETMQIISYFSNRKVDHAAWSSEGDLAPVLLELLPVARDNASVFFAMTAVVVWFMPASWPIREGAALRRSTRAIGELSVSFTPNAGSCCSQETILAAVLLYFFSLHAITSKYCKRTHLLGVGALLRQHITNRPSEIMDTSSRCLDTYLFHMSTSSTVDFSLVLPGTSVNYIDQCIPYLATQKEIDPSEVTLCHIPASLISLVFGTAYLRNEILTNSVKLSTIDRLEGVRIDDLVPPVLYSNDLTEFDALCVLYKAACHHLREYMVQEGYKKLMRPAPRPRMRLALVGRRVEEAIQLIFKEPGPTHLATWPLFVLGLAWPTQDQRTMIEAFLRKQILRSRLSSVESVLDVVLLAWRTGRGLHLMFDEAILQAIMF